MKLLPFICLLSACTFDCHITCDLPTLPDKPRLVSGVERAETYLDVAGLSRIKAHGWTVVSAEQRDHGTFYLLQRPIFAEKPQ